MLFQDENSCPYCLTPCWGHCVYVYGVEGPLFGILAVVMSSPEYILLPLWSDMAFGRVKLHMRPCTDAGEKSAGIVGRFCETPMK